MATTSSSVRLFVFPGGKPGRRVNGHQATCSTPYYSALQEKKLGREICRAAAIFLFTLCVAQFSFAQTPSQPGGGKIPPGLAQKQAFVQSLVENASSAEHIQASQDAEVLSLIALAKNNYASAVAGLKNGNTAVAENQLNEIMYRWILLLSLQMQSANSVALAAMPESKKLPEGYIKLLGSVEFLEKSYRSYVKLTAPQPVGALSGEDEKSAIFAEGLAEARVNAAMGQKDDAIRALKNVAHLMRFTINRVLDSVKVDYAMKFKTTAEEYAYELEHNRSYLELVPVAIAEFNPLDDEKLAIGKLVEKNRLAIEQARGYAEQQDYQRALATVHSGIGFLELALKTAGLVAPYVWISSNDNLAFGE